MQNSASLSRKQYAEHRGCSPSYITYLGKHGRLVLDANGKVLVKETDQMVENTGGDRPDVSSRHAAGRSNAKARNATEIQQREAPAFSGEQIGNSIAASRAIKEKYAALTAKASYETMIGNLIPREDVDAAMRFVGAAVRSAMDVFPDQQAPVLCAIADIQEVRAVLADACRNVLLDVGQAIERQKTATIKAGK